MLVERVRGKNVETPGMLRVGPKELAFEAKSGQSGEKTQVVWERGWLALKAVSREAAPTDEQTLSGKGPNGAMALNWDEGYKRCHDTWFVFPFGLDLEVSPRVPPRNPTDRSID